jgi:protein-S-isoprenylcysteine O-methyltransferase Ste14
MRPGAAILLLWIGWLISWIVAAQWSGATQERAGVGKALGYRSSMALGTVLMFIPAHGYEGSLRLWHIGWRGAWVCVGIVAAGIAIAWWARLHLGRLWSSSVTVKAEHHIYSGLLLSLLGTAAAKGTILGIAAFGFLLLGMMMKARLEEAWLASQLKQGAYADYCRRVAMIVPRRPRQ